jgi:type IV pilus assembly protein PilY1
VILNFGTGRLIPQTTTTTSQFASGTHYMFGVWDWNMSSWNSKSPTQAVSLAAPQSVTLSTLRQQTVTTATAGAVTYRTITNPQPVCWVVPEPLDASSLCPTPGTQYGWYMSLPATGEQIIFNPVLSNPDAELVVNTYIPVQDTPLSCTAATAGTGFTMGVIPDTGSGFSNDTAGQSGTGGYFSVNTNSGSLHVDGLQLNGTGIPFFIQSGQKADNNTEYLITQTANGAAPPTPVNRHSIVAGKRVNWVQRR